MKTECSKENIKITVWLIAIFFCTKIKITSGKCLCSLNILMLSSVLNNNNKKKPRSLLFHFFLKTRIQDFLVPYNDVGGT